MAQMQTQNSERGIVSMITVLFVSILLTIIALSILRQTLNEERGAIDLMLSTKAYYAAEAGVEDALYEIKTGGLVSDNSCDETASLFTLETGITEYTCRLTLSESDTVSDTIDPNAAVQFDFSGGTTFDKLLIRWHRQGEDPFPLTSTNYGYATSAPWVNPRSIPYSPTPSSPPVLRLEVIAFPNGAFERDSIRRQVYFVRPSLAGPVTELDANLPFDRRDPGSSAYPTPINVNSVCPAATPNGEYVCEVRFGSAAAPIDNSLNYIVRLSTLYDQEGPTSVEIVAQDLSNINVPQSVFDVIIDVTARSNDVFRRVRYTIPRADTTDLLPFSLLSNERICKNPEVDPDNNNVMRGGNNACI